MSWVLSGLGHVAGGAANLGKTALVGGALSGAFHGFLGYATYDPANNDPLGQTQKMAGAWAVDNAVDIAGMAASGIGGTVAGAAAKGVKNLADKFYYKTALTGSVGNWALKGAQVAGWGWMGASMLATFAGVDPSTLVQTAYDHLEQSYNKRKYGNGGINLSQSSATHVQGQIRNMMSSTNPAELMHNFKKDIVSDYLSNNEQNKRQDICWSNNKVPRRKVETTCFI